MRIIVTTIFTTCFLFLCSAQKIIEGIITDKASGNVLIAVKVWVPKTDITANTDLNGYFNLEVPEETTHIIVSYPG